MSTPPPPPSAPIDTDGQPVLSVILLIAFTVVAASVAVALFRARQVLSKLTVGAWVAAAAPFVGIVLSVIGISVTAAAFVSLAVILVWGVAVMFAVCGKFPYPKTGQQAEYLYGGWIINDLEQLTLLYVAGTPAEPVQTLAVAERPLGVP